LHLNRFVALARTSAMDSHPPARRPHKSPAHTVKDLRNRPQRLVPSSSPKCPREPHMIHAFSGTSTPREGFFSLSGGGWNRVSGAATSAGRALCTGRRGLGRGSCGLTPGRRSGKVARTPPGAFR
jgi:hypothetical protein